MDGDELYLLASVNEPENYHYALQKINAERTQQTTLVADLPHGFVPIDTLAADDENLYWIDGQTSDASHIEQIVYAISKTDGTTREIYRWQDLPPGPRARIERIRSLTIPLSVRPTASFIFAGEISPRTVLPVPR